MHLSPEVDCETAGCRSSIADWSSRYPIIVAVEAHIRRGDCEAYSMDFFVGAVWRFRICCHRLDNMCASDAIYSSRPNCVVCAIKCDGVVWRTTPSNILVVANYGEDPRIGVGYREYQRVGDRAESIIATAGC